MHASVERRGGNAGTCSWEGGHTESFILSVLKAGHLGDGLPDRLASGMGVISHSSWFWCHQPGFDIFLGLELKIEA